MKRVVAVLAAVALVGTAVIVRAHEAHKHAKTSAPTAAQKEAAPATRAKAPLAAPIVTKVNLIGELIDPQCWFTHNGEGKGHAACAVKCAKGGQDLAFLEARSGEVHTLIATGHGKNPNDGLYEHVGVPVRVRGTLYQRGTNRGLLLDAVEHAK